MISSRAYETDRRCCLHYLALYWVEFKVFLLSLTDSCHECSCTVKLHQQRERKEKSSQIVCSHNIIQERC